MKTPLGLMIATVLFLLVGLGGSAMNRSDGLKDSVSADIVSYTDGMLLEDYGVDPDPMTIFELLEEEDSVLDPFPTEEHLKVIGRIADNVTRLKKKEGGWWECGEFYQDEEHIRNRALSYAYQIVYTAWEVSDPPDNEDAWALNPWGLAGTIWNESKFDRCAFGLYPRKKSYELGLLKKSRLTLSHKEEDVIRAVTSPKMQEYFKKTGFDLGVAQLLSRFYTRPDDYAFMLSLKGGTMEAAKAMRDRARLYQTVRPWAYWPGRYTFWYDEKVTRWAQLLGAMNEEI